MSDTEFEIDNSSLDTSENWPDELRIIQPPTKTSYVDGEEIDLTGIVVQAYKDGEVWEDEDGYYQNGIIPIDELLLDTNYASDSNDSQNVFYTFYLQESDTKLNAKIARPGDIIAVKKTYLYSKYNTTFYVTVTLISSESNVYLFPIRESKFEGADEGYCDWPTWPPDYLKDSFLVADISASPYIYSLHYEPVDPNYDGEVPPDREETSGHTLYWDRWLNNIRLPVYSSYVGLEITAADPYSYAFSSYQSMDTTGINIFLPNWLYFYTSSTNNGYRATKLRVNGGKTLTPGSGYEQDDTYIRFLSKVVANSALSPTMRNGIPIRWGDIEVELDIDIIHVVQFVAWNGDVLKTENVSSGFPAHPPQDVPARDGWVFTGWDQPYDSIQSDIVIHATYSRDQYFTVTFRGYDGKVLKKELAYRGSNATPPGRVPSRPGYHFTGWSGSYKNIQQDTTVWAMYEPGEDGDKPKRIKIEFDTQMAPLPLRMLLATRSGDILGELPINHIHFTDDLGSGSEIAFQVYKERCLDQNDEINEKFWRKIESMRLGYCPEFDEWYELDVEFTDSSEKVKSVTAISLGEAELSQIRVFNIEINTDVDIAREDYAPTTLYNSFDKSCSLIDRLLYKAPHYTIKHVDSSIADLQRTFQFNDRSIYDSFQDIGKEIGCLFRIECRKEEDQNIVREISVYDLWNQCLNCGARGEFTECCNKCGSTDIHFGYGEDTTIYVDKDNLADKVVFSTDIDSIKNCFRLSAGDDLMTAVIVSCNPNGSQYMWYIPEYMQEDMSDQLREKLNEYNRLFDYYQNEYRLLATPMLPDE